MFSKIFYSYSKRVTNKSDIFFGVTALLNFICLVKEKIIAFTFQTVKTKIFVPHWKYLKTLVGKSRILTAYVYLCNVTLQKAEYSVVLL